MKQQQYRHQQDSIKSAAVAINHRIIAAAEAAIDWRDKLDRLRSIWMTDGDKFNEINTATLLHRYAKALPGHQLPPDEHSGFLNSMDRKICAVARLFDAQGQVSAACSYARMNRASEHPLKALAQAAFRGEKSYNAYSLSALVWAHGTLQTEDQNFDREALKLGQAMIKQFEKEPYACSNMVWGLACRKPKNAKCFVLPIIGSLAEMDFGPLSLMQMHHVGIAAGIDYPRALREKIAPVVSRFETIGSEPNKFELQVEEALKSLLLTVDRQVPIEGYRADFVLRDSDPATIIELDGVEYHHLNADGSGEFVGSDVLRNRVFEALGYRVVRISDAQWSKVDDQELWLMKKLGGRDTFLQKLGFFANTPERLLKKLP